MPETRGFVIFIPRKKCQCFFCESLFAPATFLVRNTAAVPTCCVDKMKAAAALLGISAVSSRVSGFVALPTSVCSVSNGEQQCNPTTSSHHALGTAAAAEDGQAERPPERQFISILTEGGSEQLLPVASASSFPLWVIEKDDSGRQQVVQVPTASSSGWVDPRSYSELWIPEESPAPTMKLCLGMLLRDGVPRYVMPMVDLVVSKAGDRWRNRGLNSVPIPYCWEPVGRAAGGVLSISAYVEEKVEGSDVDSMWGTLANKLPVKEAFTDIVGVLADPPEGVQLDSGFHFLVAEVAGVGPLPVPAPGGRVRLFLSDLPEPSDLLELPTAQGVAALSFDVFSVANGGESEFLPEVYKPLFISETA